MNLTERQIELLEVARARAGGLGPALTVEELAKFLSVSLRTIRRMDADGRGPPRQKRRGYRYFYPLPGLLRWHTASESPSHEAGGDDAGNINADGIVGAG